MSAFRGRKALIILLGGALIAGCGSRQERSGSARGSGGERVENGKEEHERHEEGIVELTPEQRATAKVATATVEKRSQAGLLEATAQIEPAADRVARVGTRVAGRITALKAGAGDVVGKGATLAIVESADLGRVKADYYAALALAKVAEETAERERALYEKQISSQRDWREAEAAATRARAEKEASESRLHALGISDAELAQIDGESTRDPSMPITTPIGGVVVERSVTLGQTVVPSDTLFVVMDLRQVWILIDVYDEDLRQVRVGQRVEARVAAYPDKAFTGRIENIGAVVEPRTRTVKVRVAVPNPTGELKPGMFATVKLTGTTGRGRERLYVPTAAVQRDGDESIVFVPRGERAFERREVRVGTPAGDWIGIEEGLAEGERVVTTGSFILKSELKKGELGGEE